MFYPLQFPVIRRLTTLLCCFSFVFFGQPPRAQDSPAKKETAPSAAPADKSELATRDTPAEFKVRVNLVQVRVVVRDARGSIIDNLRREDFQLFDGRKLQVISTFAAETPASRRLKVTPAPPNTGPSAPDAGTMGAATVALPERFVALVFDDGHMAMQDTLPVRVAAKHFLEALSATDRIGIYTTSGQLTQEFTSDRELLNNSLLGLAPRPIAGTLGSDCPDVSYYQADLIENRRDDQAFAVAVEDAIQCGFNGDHRKADQAQSLVRSASRRALAVGDAQGEYTYRHLEDVLRRLSAMPGERVMVLVSPGFLMSTLELDSSEIIDRANRSNIVINTLDARGLYTADLMGDIASPPRSSFNTAGFKSSYRISAQSAQAEVLAEFAAGTGGTFFHNSNDLDEGLRQAGIAPPSSYLLGFSPQNLKLDGSYHTLRVALANKQKYSIQARHGYYAPRNLPDPKEAAKQEIQEAVFSQEEIHDIPLELQTQFFKKDELAARLSVLTRLDLKGLRFRKAEGRNFDNLTVATAIFDENGNYVTGGEKIVEMRLLEATYQRLSRSGLSLKSSFAVQPGKYLVRLVIRDAEGSQMAARNAAVVIPY